MTGLVTRANGNTSFSEKVFDISMAEIESIVLPYCVGYDVRRESVSFICIEIPILTILNC